MKTCSRCKKSKSTAEFYGNKSSKDKLNSWCKQCSAEYKKLPQAKESYKKSIKKYLKTQKGKEYQRKKSRKAWEKHKYKKSAKNVISYMTASGEIPPASECNCAKCNKKAHEYHHPDYTRQKYVIPLCIKCHKKEHKYEQK